MGTYKRKISIILFLLSFSICLTSLLLNRNKVLSDNPQGKPRNNATLIENWAISSADDEYYSTPVQNFIEKGDWRRSPTVGKGSYFRRVPGYSLFQFFFVSLFGIQTGIFLLVLFQTIFFALSVVFLFRSFSELGIPVKYGLICSTIYSTFPAVLFWPGFIITEAITPVLMIFLVRFIVRLFADPSSVKDWLLAGFFLGALIYTRPYTAFVGLPLLIIAFQSRNYLIRNLLLGFLFPALFAGIWMVRNYVQTGEIVVLEKAFHPNSLDRMKPEFRGMFELAKTWGADGGEFNVIHQPFYVATIDGDTNYQFPGAILEKIPAEVRETDEGELITVLKLHQTALRDQAPYYHALKQMPDTFLTSSLKAEEEYERLVSALRQHSFIDFVLQPRLIYLSRIIFHSGTAHIHFLADDAPFLIKFIKGYSYLIHVIIYLLLIPGLWILRRQKGWWLFTFTPLLAIIFFSCLHREVEQRYMLPFIPLIFTSAALTLQGLFGKEACFKKINTDQ